MRRRLIVLAALTLTACGPRPPQQAEICAIFALPGIPGDTQTGDAADRALAATHERQLYKSGTIYGPGWQVLSHGRSWGRCPARAKPIEHLLISPDHTYAMTKGGRRANGHPVSFGSCYYDRGQTGWRLRACRRSLNDPVPLIPQKFAPKPAP